jgi:hypothetical protein
MHKLVVTICLTLALIASALSWLPSKQIMQAASEDDLAQVTVSPASVYVQVSGGDEHFLEYTLENFSTHTLTVNLEAQSFQAEGEDGTPTLLGRLDFPAEPLLYQTPSEPILTATLLPRSQKKVLVRLAPPLGVTVQEYPMVLFFKITEATTVPTGQSAVDLNLGSNLIVFTENSNLDRSQLRLAAPNLPGLIDSFLGLPPQEIRVINEGVAGTLISGYLQLQRPDGTPIVRWDFYPDLVLGHQTRIARGKVVNDQGEVTDLISAFVLPQPLFGRYELIGQVISGHPEASAASVTDFEIPLLACPYLVLGGLLLLIVMIGMIQYHQRRRTTARKLRQKNLRTKKQRRYFS